MGEIAGIDVSEHNGLIDWPVIQCGFALIRTGFGYGDEDEQLAANIKNCAVPYGFYHFSYAHDTAAAEREADFVLSLLKKYGAKPTLPVFFDWEDDSDRYCKNVKGVTMDSRLYTHMATAFMNRIKAAGFKAGNYYNPDYRKRYCLPEILDKAQYYQWCAFYGDGGPVYSAPEETLPYNCDIWQFTKEGTIRGFLGDVNILYNQALLSGREPPGVQRNPYNRILGNGALLVTNPYGGGHSGADVINDVAGLPDITAHSPGTVVFCQTGIPNHQGSSGNRSYGNCIKLLHPCGMCTLYAHMSDVAVHNGEQVEKGQTVGVMGNTGNSFGSHLHFEVRDTDGSTLNPAAYFNADLPGCSTAGGIDYTPGTYRITADVLTVRAGPGEGYPWLRYGALSANARAQIAENTGGRPNGYVKGMACDVCEVDGKWGKTPSGWICLIYCEKI